MILLENVEKNFRRRKILNNINISMSEGIVGVLGPNGAGKTTLLKILSNRLKPSSGKVIYVTNPKSIGYLPQSFSTFDQLSTIDAISLFASLKTGKIDNEHIDTVLKEMNLSEQQDTKVEKLSGGMKQRLGIAQALIDNPSILILDEPTNGLDINERIRLRKILLSLAKDRLIIISSHFVEDLESICNSFIVLNKGAIVAEGTSEELCKKTKTRVQKLVVSKKELDGFLKKFDVSSFIPVDEHTYELRIIDDFLVSEKAREVRPSLEESYMKILKTTCH